MKKVKVAVIGNGAIANSAHGPAYFKNPLSEIKYCVDIIPERAQAFKEKFNGEYAITDYREAIADPEVDIVSVCVPNYLHAPISIDCLKAGKHVLCEKPAAMNYEEALAMKKAADENNVILNIGVVNRFNTAVNKIKEMIDAGELGNIYHIYCSFRAYRSIPGLGGPFTTKSMAGGGVLIDWGVHYLDLIMYCIGSPALKTVSAAAYSVLGRDMKNYAYTSMWAGPPDYSGTYDVEDFVTGLVRTEGPTISLNGAWAQNINEPGTFIDFLGDKAGIRLQYGGNFKIWSSDKGVLYETTPSYQKAEMFYDEIDAFIKCSQEGKKIRSNIDNVILSSLLMDKIYESAEKGEEVRVDS
ncbi:MAG: Gfo/Idh/MocA family protein [Caldicoprobacterales bacterium]|jgi:predicted dehydrogenase